MEEIKMKKALFQRAVCLVLTVATLMTGLGFTVNAGSLKDPNGDKGIYTTLEEMQALVSTSAYADYIEDYAYLKTAQSGLSPIVVDVLATMQAGSSGVKVTESDKCQGVVSSPSYIAGGALTNNAVYLPAVGATSWEFTVTAAQEGLYYFKWDYFTCETSESSISSIERGLKINGKVPFDEARALNFSKIWGYNNIVVSDPVATDEDDYSKVEYKHVKGEGGSYKKIVTTVKDGYKTVTTYTLSQDINGNSMAPEAAQTPQWNEYYCQDSSGYEQEWFLFYVSEGDYRITLEAEREPMIIGGLTLIPYSSEEKEILSYEDYLAAHPGATAPQGGSINDIVKIEAEFPDAISDASVAPSNDNTSASTFPIASGAQLYNVIGETSYSSVGQWAAYKFTVNKTGLYKLGMRYLQKALEGMFISRSVKLAGGEYGNAPVTPYEEAASAKFNYSKDWQSTYVCDDSGDALQFYFEEGVEYTVYFECSLGSLKSYIQRVEDTLANLNECYLRILQLTGPDPDKYRDYKFYQVMPDVLVTLLDEARNLMAIKAELENFCGTAGSHTATLETVAVILYKMGLDKGEKVAANMASLKTYLGTLGTWINDSKRGAMMVDSISVIPANLGDDALEKAEAGFFKSLWFELVSFIYSFFTDYNAMGLTKKPTTGDNSIDVWLALGRDQSQIWRTMIDAKDTGYTDKTGNAANLKLVTAGTLLPSILSGKGPDVYMGLASGDVINYAIRDAVMGISGNVPYEKDKDADSYNKYFANNYYTYKNADGDYKTYTSKGEAPAGYELSFESKSYNDYIVAYDKGRNGVAYEDATFSQAAIDTVTLLDVAYGIPQTMSFAMMFYRMDVFAQLGLNVPESWSQLLATLPVLQTNNMEIGVAYISALDFMIYQMGGSMWKYTDKDLYESKYAGARIDLDSDVAIEAFEFTCRLYTDYSLPISYDTANRFRTGEMPIVVGDYASIYNTLVVYATEINGLWEFTSLPGSERKDGTFNYDSLAGVTATVMLHGCENPLAAWQFIQWQTGDEAQSNYGNRMVALVGPSAKYESANLKALNNLSWTASEKEAIKDQMMNLSSIVNYPGSYIIARYLKFAFLDAVNDGADPTDALRGYIDAINSEIERKREEFDLPIVGNEGAPKIEQNN